MAKNNIPMDDMTKNSLKQKALEYLPRNLGEVEGQQKVLQMIEDAIPQIMSVSSQAQTQIWPKVADHSLSMNQAIAQCAFQTDKIIEAAFLENLALESLPEQTLLNAWIALDYYAYVLKPEYSFNIRNVQGYITEILLSDRKHRQPEDVGVTQPVEKVEPFAPTEKPKDKPEPQKSQAATKKVEQPKKPVKKTPSKEKKAKKGGKGVLLIALAVAAVILVVLLMPNKVAKAEKAIDAIGTVTLDSGEAIENAEALVEALEEEKREELENYDVLLRSREEYDCLRTEAAIDAIGKVTPESEEAIVSAEDLYGSLTQDAQNKVDNYQTLVSARKEYDRQTAAIQKAKDAIDAIGTVNLDSGSKIEEARKAYDELVPEGLESYVADKLPTLTKAEGAYAQQTSKALYDAGVKLCEEGKHQEALDNFNTILQKYPQSGLYSEAEAAAADCTISLAEQAYSAYKTYDAANLLESLSDGYKNHQDAVALWDKIHTRLKNARPNNGTTLESTIGWGQCYVEITAADQDLCIKLEDKANSGNYKLVYVRAGMSTRINVKDGDYLIKWATGEYWFDKEHHFGNDTVYEQEQGYLAFVTRWEGNMVYFWTFTLDLNDNVHDSAAIRPDEF